MSTFQGPTQGPVRSTRPRPLVSSISGKRAQQSTYGDALWSSQGAWMGSLEQPMREMVISAENACEDTETPSDACTFMRKQSKSFSTVNSVARGIRSVMRRASTSVRSQTFAPGASPCEERSSNQIETLDTTSAASNRWLRRATSFRHIRRSSSIFSFPPGSHSPHTPNDLSSNPTNSETSMLQYDLQGGAAARAAAAAQNELLGLRRVAEVKNEVALAEPGLKRDSESGIGIEIRSSVEEYVVENAPIVRKDPVNYLPSELTSHILSFLDPLSLMEAECVSQIWNRAATSHHVWREVFHEEFHRSLRPRNSSITPFRVGGAGMGKLAPEQDWKRMWQVRKQLEARWLNGNVSMVYFSGHADSVYCVQFDENKIITGSRDRTIRVWDIHTWQCLKVIGPPIPLPPVAVVPQPPTPLGSTVLQPTVTPWGNAATAQPLTNPPQTCTPSDYHHASILCLQFDEEIMVTGSSDSTCIVWDIKNDYNPIHRLQQHTSGVLDICFDKKHVVSCSKDSTICVWDRETGELLKQLRGHRGPVNSVQLRGDLVVSASGDAAAKLWNIGSGLCIKEFLSKDRGLACIEFSEDARIVLAGGNDQVIYKFDANTGELVNSIKGHTGLVRSLHLDNANRRIVSGSYDMSVKIFDSETGELQVSFPGWTTSWILAAKADYRRVVCSSQDGRVLMMDFGHNLMDVNMLEG
ncbi:MAG: hypothetical protein M1827_006237 [Pycnora praestabilis]|nr:MAG: hypothetical protein M1827_006237 [Pycnora praestabilis]